MRTSLPLMWRASLCAIAIALPCWVPATSVVEAGQVWFQGFETDASGWFDSDDVAGYGYINRVASGGGTLGLTAATGNYYAEVTQAGPVGDESGPYSHFDMYRDTWPGGMTASIDIYLDTTWAAGQGFDYDVSASDTSGGFRRDFIFHVAQDTSTGQLLVGGDNNSTFAPREDLETVDHYAVTSSGWYTFQDVFHDNGDGTLAVDLNLLDSGGSLLFSKTLNDPSDVLGVTVGGNHYSWFPNVDIAGAIGVDNHSLSIVPEPSTFALAVIGLASAGFWVRRRRQKP